MDDPGVTRLPVRRPDVAWVVVDDSVVAVEASRGTVHELQGSAAVVWQLLDGEPIGGLDEDLAESFGIPVGEAREGLLGALEVLRARGLTVDPSTF